MGFAEEGEVEVWSVGGVSRCEGSQRRRMVGVGARAVANWKESGTYRKTCFSPRGGLKRFGRRGRRGRGEGFLKNPGLGRGRADPTVLTPFIIDSCKCVDN